MATLTDAQKKRLKAHSKHHTIAHVKKMAKLMREGKSFSKAHTAAMKTDPPKQKQKQKQKQTQSQRVVVNVGTIPRRRGRRPAAKPRPMSYQQDTSRVLGQFSPLPPYTPPPLINDMPRPMPFQEATRTPVRVANEFAVRPPVATGQMLSGLPAVSPPLAPPSSLQRQSSAERLGRSVSQIGEMVGSLGATMNPEPLRAEDVAEFKRVESATREFERGGGGGGELAGAKKPTLGSKGGRLGRKPIAEGGKRNAPKAKPFTAEAVITAQAVPANVLQFSTAEDVAPSMLQDKRRELAEEQQRNAPPPISSQFMGY